MKRGLDLTGHKQIAIDWSDVHRYDCRVLFIGVPLFMAYGLVLSLVCALGENILTTIFFVAIQLASGLPASRYANHLGRKSKSHLSLQDPSRLKNGWRIDVRETHNSDMERIFEGFHTGIREADRKTIDDINDLAWFIIIVWVMISSVIPLIIGWVTLVCVSSSVVLGLVCLFTYYYGHRGLIDGYYEDDLAHLEFYVTSRLSALSELEKESIPKVMWKIRNNAKVLYDFFIVIAVSESIQIRYHLGIPSKESERFLIEGPASVIDRISRRIEQEHMTDWRSNRENESLTLSYTKNIVDLRERGTYIQFPNEPLYIRDAAAKLLRIITEDH